MHDIFRRPQIDVSELAEISARDRQSGRTGPKSLWGASAPTSFDEYLESTLKVVTAPEFAAQRARIASFKGRLSNSPDLEGLCALLHRAAAERLPECIGTSFVIKDTSDSPEAFALHQQAALHAGQFIFVDRGMLNLVTLYAENYAEFIYVAYGYGDIQIQADKVLTRNKNISDLFQLERLNRLWRDDLRISFDDDTPVPLQDFHEYVYYYKNAAIAFILTHEYSHHYLRHFY